MKRTRINLKHNTVLIEDDPEWSPPPITVYDVKIEAKRRIEKFAPVWRQINALREGDVGLFSRIDAIRMASDKLEERDPIPSDYASDEHWPKSDEA